MRRQHGFTYLGLIILVAIIGMVGAAGLKVNALLQRAAAEEELLEIGAQYSAALKSYADATPRGRPRFPATLNELLRDPRFPGVRRHLRKVFVDPITGRAEWGIIYLGEKAGVLGVYSLSDAQPLKIANFDARFAGFENKKKISEWKFMLPGQTMVTGAQQTGGVPSLFGQPTPPQNVTPGVAAPGVATPPEVPPAPALPVSAPGVAAPGVATPLEPTPALEAAPPVEPAPDEKAGQGESTDQPTQENDDKEGEAEEGKPDASGRAR